LIIDSAELAQQTARRFDAMVQALTIATSLRCASAGPPQDFPPGSGRTEEERP